MMIYSEKLIKRLFMEEVYTIDNAKKEELVNIYRIQHGLGWGPLLNGKQFFQVTDMNGVFFGKLNGEIISSITAMNYGKYGFIGVYWVKKEHRGKGYGLQIFKRAMQYLKNCEIVGLDGVEEQLKNYEKSGFVTKSNSIKAYTIQKPDFIVPITTNIVTDAKAIDVKEVGEFDSLYFHYNRTPFLERAFSLGTPIVSYDKETGKIRGYGIVNQMQFGVSIGPLIAQTPQIAQEILYTFFNISIAKQYYDDVNKIVSKWFPQHMYVCQRMYNTKKGAQDFSRKNIYGLTSYERG